MKRLLRRCEYPGCWARWEVEAVLAQCSPDDDPAEIRARFCEYHGDHLASLAMKGADRVRIFEGENDEQPVSEFLGVEAATRRLALEKGIPLRQARRELERQRRKGGLS